MIKQKNNFRTLLLSGVILVFGVFSAVSSAAKEPSGQNLLFFDDAGNVSPKDDNVAPNVSLPVLPGEVDNKSSSMGSDAPVDLLADRVEYDENAGIVSAVGKVELVQSGRILRAEKVSYYMQEDRVKATGDVVLNETTGDTYFADEVELKDKMKDGFVRGLSGVLADGSRFTAEEGEKIADLRVIMKEATYTACEPCKADPSRPPIWRLRADEVTHHKDEQRVTYNNAWFDVMGQPVLYTPYFAHPDGSVKRKSGFLTPTAGFDSDLGAYYQQEYYWDIAPEKDATMGAVAMTNELPLLYGQYRQRYENANIELNGGATYSSRTDRVAGQETEQDKEKRGHFFAKGLWDINQKWRAGTDMQLVSDEQYLRQYDVTDEDVLETKAYVERFSGRDYGMARAIHFKDIRVSDRQVDQPNVLPEIYASFLGDPNGLLGGRWNVGLSALGLNRIGKDQDMLRGTIDIGWQRRHVSSFGLVSTLDIMSRGDAYSTKDRDIAQGNQRSQNATALRGIAGTNFKTGYPLKKSFGTSEIVIEPLVALTAMSNLNDTDEIPNEDSQDVFLDSTNIFEPNRFPGYDRIEDEVHATYGLRSGLYTFEGYQGEVFLGQSYRFDDDDNPFPAGSGLSRKNSDLVGNISMRAGDLLQFNYGMQLDSEDLSSRRHELDLATKVGPASFGSRYFFAQSLQGTDLDDSREQINLSGKYQFTDQWSAFAGGQYDLAESTEGLRKLGYGVEYEGQCVNFLVSGQRTLTNDSAGDSGTEVMVRVGLKNLGEFETTAFTLGSGE